jgi:hypothetical protein
VRSASQEHVYILSRLRAISTAWTPAMPCASPSPPQSSPRGFSWRNAYSRWATTRPR